MPNPVVHFEITGKDGKALQEFYGKLFDWHVDADNPMGYGIVDTHAGGINGGISASEDGMSQVTIYIEVDDPDVFLKKVESMGGKTVVPTTVIPDMVTFALFSDPEGHVVGLVKSDAS